MEKTKTKRLRISKEKFLLITHHKGFVSVREEGEGAVPGCDVVQYNGIQPPTTSQILKKLRYSKW